MKQSRADLLIFTVTLCWGSSYLFMKMGMDSLSPYNLIALRFGLAFILTALIFFRQLRHLDWRTTGYGALLGLCLFGVFAFIMFGLQTTSTSNAGFLVSLTVIFVPILYWLLFRRALAGKQIVGVLLAVIGIGLLTLNGQLAIHPGDALCILAALCYAGYILITGAAARLTRSTLNLGIMQLGFAGLYGLIFSLIFEAPTLPHTGDGWLAVLALSVVCSAFGFVVQPIAQKYTTPTRTGLIFSLEPVFAALFAYWFEHEMLSVKGYIGAGLVLAGVVVSEWKLGGGNKRKRRRRRAIVSVQEAQNASPL